jgi:hypothetical protein
MNTLQGIKQLYGDKLGASDGEIGHIKDFYFDDKNWAIRYVVVETGSWLADRQILLSPHSLGGLDQAGKILRVNLTRKLIENSPPIESRKPISRQYEEDYYRHYGWPSYWQGDALWGASEFPTAAPTSVTGQMSTTGQIQAHLRSVQAVNGFNVRTGLVATGHICDFMMNAQSWAIGQLVVKTGHRFSGKDIQISTRLVRQIHYDESTVFIDLSREDAGKI